MSNIIQISDFDSGRNAIAVNTYQEADLQAYIDRVEKQILIELLGKELYDLFIADLVGGVPQTAIYVSIYEPFNDYFRGCYQDSEGMIAMLTGFVYFDYVRDQFSKQNTVGIKKVKGENTEFVSTTGHDLYTRYNNAGKSYKAIQDFIKENSDDYPTYDGRPFQAILNL